MAVLPNDIDIFLGADTLVEAFLKLQDGETVASCQLAIKKTESDADDADEAVIVDGVVIDDGATSLRAEMLFTIEAVDVEGLPLGSRFYGAVATLTGGQKVALASCRGVATVKSAGPTG